MKSHCILLTALMVLALFGFGQQKDKFIYLKSGAISVSPGSLSSVIDDVNLKLKRFNKTFVIIQFEEAPTEAIKQRLASNGIELLNYIPDNAYTASVKGNLNTDLLRFAKARALYQPTAQEKLDASLVAGTPPPTSVKVPGTVDVWVSFLKTYSVDEVSNLLKQFNVNILATDLASYQVLSLRIAINKIFQLAEQPYIEYVVPAPPPDQPLLNNSRSLSHANVLNALIGDGGKGLNGEGITIGIGDNSDIQSHLDFTGRLVNRFSGGTDFHGINISGIAAGGGLANELYRGYMPKARIVSQSFNGILLNAATYVADYNMIVTNNSYGAAVGCQNNGIYDFASNFLDKQAFEFPYLQHVFAVGNSGALTCAPYPIGFRTALGAYQTAKNVICVGNTNFEGVLSPTSSRGPVRDGRLKPEVTAQGTGVVSTWLGGTQYQGTFLNGTSPAAPAVAGGVGLLYQYYRQLHSNQDPKSALVKALICNGANDKGNAGPDYKYGFGSMNLLRSVNMLENNRYFTSSISVANTATHSISVPANTAKLKVMLYWHDPAASILAAKALVNDLDLELVNPSSTTLLPLVLDSTFSHVDDVATNGADHTNNIEQIVIDNPAAGSYNIKVKATAINQNPAQEYFVVYDIIPNSIQLTYPAGGEGLVPGEFINIAWEANGDAASDFKLQYSTDNGTNWIDIANNIAAGTQLFSWQVPAIPSDKSFIRVIKNSTGQSHTSNRVSIVGVPTVFLSPIQCEGYFAIEWPAVSGATEYQVMMLRGSEMVPVGTTSGTSFTFKGLSKDSVYWVGIRAGINGKWGRRSVAVSRQPNDGSCSGAIADNDLTVRSVVSPTTGRKFTSTELSANSVIKIEVKNLDDVPSNGFTVKYSIDGNNWNSEHITTSILPGSNYIHDFASLADLSAPGSYLLKAVVINDDVDSNIANDTLATIIKHFDNQPLVLSSPFKDDFESVANFNYENKTVGLDGGARYDFENSTSLGRLRSFINSGIAYSGAKALSLDIKSQSATSNVNYVTGTFNLSNYSASNNELRLDFQFNFHGNNVSEGNKIWMRGSDTDPWILMYDLFENKAPRGIYKLTPSIELSDSLLKYGQNFSSSFQIRWAQNGSFPIVDKRSAAGVSIDDLRIYEVVSDAQIVSIDNPVGQNCNLSNSVPLKITIHNGTSTQLTQVPVKYSINGGAWISETIPAINGESTITYDFSTPADFSKPGQYVIKAVVAYNNDNFRSNDTLTSIVQSLAYITVFPYLQNFEENEGAWFSEGTLNSWQYGTPASAKIRTAASGTKAWKTNLSGDYNNEEFSYLYSPCFNIAGMVKPTISFSAAFDLEDCGTTPCDRAWVEYSLDGINWLRIIDTANSSTNWYNKTTSVHWSIENYTWWHMVTASLPTGANSIRLRFVLQTDQGATREGIAIDDVHVYDNIKGIYSGNNNSAVTQNVSGNSWVNFERDGKLIASVLSNNQNLGTTAVQLYLFTDSVRDNGSQYYHNRSLTIKPTQTSFNDSVTVRFYFLDTETEALLKATGCAGCTKPSSAYELGVSQYDDYDTSFENGSIHDNQQGLWSYLAAGKVTKVPFDKGYYAEFKVKDFSEFWLNNGAFDKSTSLPVKLLAFFAQKNGTNALLNWNVALESNVVRYEIEVARNAADLQANRFEKIGEVPGSGNNSSSQYNFIDTEDFKSGERYYRLRIINRDGTAHYSLTRSVIFEPITKWQVVPNPSAGLFYFIYQSNSGEEVNMQLTDAIGKIIKRISTPGNGSLQKLAIDISAGNFAAGIYFLQVDVNGTKQVFKLYKK